MLDEVLDIASDVLEGISERASLPVRTKRILEILAMILGLLSIVYYIGWNKL